MCLLGQIDRGGGVYEWGWKVEKVLQMNFESFLNNQPTTPKYQEQRQEQQRRIYGNKQEQEQQQCCTIIFITCNNWVSTPAFGTVHLLHGYRKWRRHRQTERGHIATSAPAAGAGATVAIRMCLYVCFPQSQSIYPTTIHLWYGIQEEAQ